MLSNLRIDKNKFFITCGTLLGVYLLSKLLKLLRSYNNRTKLLKLALKKRFQRNEQIKNFKIPKLDIDPSLEKEVLAQDATGLLEMLRTEKITSEQMLLIFIKRTVTIGLDLELITEINFEEALEQARSLDQLRKKDPSKCKGELFGLPISIKDNYELKGKDSTMGIAARCFQAAKEDGVLVKLLKHEGAIPFVKSNIPQIMMMAECGNHIWGRGKNPWNKERTVGGSSGGEGGLIASGCSPLGLGNDIGGSGRIPALFCGVVGFKSTHELVTSEGSVTIGPVISGMLNMRVSHTPIARSVRDVNLMMKTLLNSDYLNKLGPATANAFHYKRKWREELVFEEKPLVIGYYKSIDLFPATAANQRAVEEAARALEKRGHKVIEVSFPMLEEAAYLWMQTFTAGGMESLFGETLKGEPHIPEYNDSINVTKIPKSLIGVVKKILALIGEKRKSKLINYALPLSTNQLLKMISRQQELQREFLRIWEDNRLDALISPGTANPAFKHFMGGEMNLALSYTFIYNILNLPTGAVPVTVVKNGEDCYPKEICKENDSYYRWEVKNMQGSVGMPIGVQISTLPYEDEKCVNVMRQLEEEIQFAKKHPLPI
jgi:Asp-tRNAAsn/Glu-tRNAGln amidotransferase A subunit and related amidases